MSVNSTWRVTYEFQDGNKKRGWDGEQVAYVIAADNKFDTIKTVLTNNNIARPGATLNIVSVQMAPGNSANVLS